MTETGIEESSVWQNVKDDLLGVLGAVQFWVGLLCVSSILTVSTPFESSSNIGVLQRLVYWPSICAGTYVITHLTAATIFYMQVPQKMSVMLLCVLSGLAGTLPVSFFVYFVDTFIVGVNHMGIYHFWYLLPTCAIIIAAATYIQRALVTRLPKSNPVDAVSKSDFPPELTFLKRLSPENHGEILSIQSQDHYLEVTTKSGTELILMRLKDAAEELASVDGKRVHRSWWVAKQSVDAIVSEENKIALRLVDGRVIPVSRSNKSAVRAWMQ